MDENVVWRQVFKYISSVIAICNNHARKKKKPIIVHVATIFVDVSHSEISMQVTENMTEKLLSIFLAQSL